MGSLPSIFNGDRTQADRFIEGLKAYFRLNHAVPTFRSWITCVALALTCIQGEKVENWTCDKGDWLDGLNPAIDDNLVVWQTFVNDFHDHFQDTQRAKRARMKLETLRMKWPAIDEYVSDFETTSCAANPYERSAR